MRNLLRKIIRSNHYTSNLYQCYLLLQKDSYLQQAGWFASAQKSRPVSADGTPLPWLAYPAIEFLDAHLPPSATLFEYGSGGSTFWFAQRVRRVISCEHDERWYRELKPRLPGNVEYLLEPIGDSSTAYSSKVALYPDVDVVLIDGRDRSECASVASQGLSPSGVLVWDDTDRARYRSGIGKLEDSGLSRLDFDGIGPLSHLTSRTSIFYRPKVNCLGI
jgi:hypothetical protein